MSDGTVLEHFPRALPFLQRLHLLLKLFEDIILVPGIRPLQFNLQGKIRRQKKRPCKRQPKGLFYWVGTLQQSLRSVSAPAFAGRPILLRGLYHSRSDGFCTEKYSHLDCLFLRKRYITLRTQG